MDRIARTRALFDSWDTNGDGVLDFKEILSGCLATGMEPDDVIMTGGGRCVRQVWLEGEIFVGVGVCHLVPFCAILCLTRALRVEKKKCKNGSYFRDVTCKPNTFSRTRSLSSP